MSGFQAQTGMTKSKPKLTRINGDDDKKIVYRNLGNNHAYPFVWADLCTVASGTQEIVVASGIKFHGYELATYCNITASPLADLNGRWYIEKDTTNNIIKIKTTAAPSSDLGFDVKFMLGTDSNIDTLYCRGTGNPMPALP